MEVDKLGHEVMVCYCGNCWKLRLKRNDAGPMELPTVYSEEGEAVRAAFEFIRSRRADSRYAREVWFCGALPEPCCTVSRLEILATRPWIVKERKLVDK